MTQAEIDRVLQGFVDEIFYKCKTGSDFQNVRDKLLKFYDDNHLKDEQMQLFFDSNAGELMGLWLPE